jgi:hypothetical protein
LVFDRKSDAEKWDKLTPKGHAISRCRIVCTFLSTAISILFCRSAKAQSSRPWPELQGQDRSGTHRSTGGPSITAFNQQTTPKLEGRISRIGAAVVEEQKTNTSYYPVRIALTPDEIQRLGNVKLVPGMLAESFIKTSDFNITSYLVKQLKDQLLRAFKER